MATFRAMRRRGVENRPRRNQFAIAAGIRVGKTRTNGRNQERAGRGFLTKVQHNTRPISPGGADSAIETAMGPE